MRLRNCETCGFIRAYFFILIVVAVTVRFLPEYSAGINTLVMVVTSTLIFRKSPEELGFRNFRAGLKWGITASLLILPLYYLVCGGKSLELERAMSLFLFYLVVALGEETFFRGLFYSLSKNERLVGFLSKNNFASSLLFGVAHALIYQNPLMFKVFFPSLVMGWLYERTGSLFAPILFHALANVVYAFAPC